MADNQTDGIAAFEQMMLSFSEGVTRWADEVVVPALKALNYFNDAIWELMPTWMHDEYARLQAERLDALKHKNDDVALAGYLDQFSGEDEVDYATST